MSKTILTVLLSWGLSFGIYHEVTLVYILWGTIAAALALMLGVIIILMDEVKDEDVEKAKGQLFRGVSHWTSLILCTPVFLYAVYQSESWNTLAAYGGSLALIGIFMHKLNSRYNKIVREV